jgi:hypothetical protein
MPVNIFDLAGYISNIFEYEPLNIFNSRDKVLLKNPENDCNNPIFQEEPEIPKPWVKYYRQSAINGKVTYH